MTETLRTFSEEMIAEALQVGEAGSLLRTDRKPTVEFSLLVEQETVISLSDFVYILPCSIKDFESAYKKPYMD